MYRSLFPRDLFAELDRLQRDVQQAFDLSPTIRGVGRGGFPALNVGATPQSIELYAFAPGLDPASIDVDVDDRTLTVRAERKGATSEGAKWLVHERPSGTFARQLTLGYGVALDKISADYSDGVLSLRIPVAEEAKPRKIEVQHTAGQTQIEGAVAS